VYNLLKERGLSLSSAHDLANVAGKQPIDKLLFTPDRPNFVTLAEDAKAYGDRVLPQFVGEAQEELKSIFDMIHSSLENSETYARLGQNTLKERTELVVDILEEMIPELHRYGLEDTQPLEDIRNELRTWLERQGRGQGPGPSPT
jgi:hypothetical protein